MDGAPRSAAGSPSATSTATATSTWRSSTRTSPARSTRTVTAGGKYLQVDFAAPAGNRFAIGARLELEAGGKQQIRDVKTASSYLSQNALAVHFGLGKSEQGGPPHRAPPGQGAGVRGAAGGPAGGGGVKFQSTVFNKRSSRWKA